MITVVMPSFLGHYHGAAKDRDLKIVRAIRSVQKQTYKDWQLVVIADGCQKTMDLVSAMKPDNRVLLILIEKQPMFSGVPRNFGIEYAEGEWICYLDIDDVMAPNHLSSILKGASKDLDWVWFDDYIFNHDQFEQRECFLNRYKCGTSNIAHRKSMKARWEMNNQYGLDDWNFICNLMAESPNYKKIEAEYLVCHIGNKDV
jgi:glycosyltransferase involved in cell wall biosynthesis